MDTEGAGPNQRQEQAADVERIRDILFGSQTRQYDQTLAQLSARLDRIDSQLEKLEKTLKQQAKAQKAQVNDLQEDIRKRSADTELALGELHKETTSALNALTEGKASRDSVGDMLLEMGMRLKDLPAE
jgi:DNA anti-recombination protein RmuC